VVSVIAATVIALACGTNVGHAQRRLPAPLGLSGFSMHTARGHPILL